MARAVRPPRVAGGRCPAGVGRVPERHHRWHCRTNEHFSPRMHRR